MSSTQCPVCSSENHHQFWYWEKEDKLMRDWALDTRLSYSICRECSAVFQHPNVHSADSQSGFGSWGDGNVMYHADEPLIWVKQFTPNGAKKGRALEVYHKDKRFVSQLQQDGWEVVKSISASALLNPDTSNTSLNSDEPLHADDTFDVVFCVDVLGQYENPLALLQAVHPFVNQDGGIFAEVNNISVLPRLNKICLSSTDQIVYPFQSFIFMLHKAGFTNASAEISGKLRCYCQKTEPKPATTPSQVLPDHLWEHTLYRFQRNYYWAKTAKYLQDYLTRMQNEPNLVDTARAELRQDQNMLQVVRDVCGGVLLFAQEVDELKKSLSDDWFRTMQRIMDVFKNDLALFDLLQIHSIPELGLFEGVDRLHYKEKMIYITNEDYFQKYFTEDEAKQLCTGIIQSGQVVCGHLSSFL